MRICLLSYLIVACPQGQVAFKQGNETDETIIVDKDRKAETGSITQQIKPVLSNRPLDILLVIDNSGSMKSVHGKLSANLTPLLDAVQDSDWRIVITTATFTDCLRAVIDKKDSNYREAFKTAIEELMYEKLETASEQDLSNTEDTIRMATNALPTVVGSRLQYQLPLRTLGHKASVVTRVNNSLSFEDPSLPKNRPTWCTAKITDQDTDGKSAQWLRDQSMLAILLITDEDAYSGDLAYSNNKYVEPVVSSGLFPGLSSVEWEISCGCNENNLARSCKCIDKFWQRLIDLKRQPHVTAKIYGLLGEKSKFYLGWRDPEEKGEQLFDIHQKVRKEDDHSVDNFNEVLNSISTDVAQQMNKTYSLSRFPDGKTSKVVLIDSNNKARELEVTEYKIEGRNLIFTESLSTDIKMIKVTFSFSQQ